jgi:hypothetical protein
MNKSQKLDILQAKLKFIGHPTPEIGGQKSRFSSLARAKIRAHPVLSVVKTALCCFFPRSSLCRKHADSIFLLFSDVSLVKNSFSLLLNGLDQMKIFPYFLSLAPPLSNPLR